MPSCVVKWCKSHTDLKSPDITFHAFPTNDIQLENWVSAVRLERNEPAWLPSKYSKICSIHFEGEDVYVPDYGRRKRLKKSAVPVCTMDTSLGAGATFSRLPAPICLANIINTTKLKEEPTVKVEQVSDQDNSNNTIKIETDIPGCSEVDAADTYTFYEVNTDERRKSEQPERHSCVQEKNSKTIQCPKCCYKFNIDTKVLNKGNSAPFKKILKQSTEDVTDIFNTLKRYPLKRQLEKKKTLARRRLLTIKKIQQEISSLKTINSTLESIIENAKKSDPDVCPTLIQGPLGAYAAVYFTE